MANEGAGKERDANLRRRLVTIAPCAAIQRIEVLRAACDHADRQSATDHLTVGCDVGAYTEQRLSAPRVGAKAGYHFVEDERRFEFRSDFAQLEQEVARLVVRVTALHRLDQNSGEFAAHGLYRLQGSG